MIEPESSNGCNRSYQPSLSSTFNTYLSPDSQVPTNLLKNCTIYKSTDDLYIVHHFLLFTHNLCFIVFNKAKIGTYKLPKICDFT